MPCPCSPFPYSLPNGFSNGDQRHWVLSEAWKDAKPLTYDPLTDEFHKLSAEDDQDPQYVIEPEAIPVEVNEPTGVQFDECGVATEICLPKPCVRAIEPVGPICATPKNFNFILARELCVHVQESDDFSITTHNIFLDSNCFEVCDKPPILKRA